ncbi:MAG TPA: NAD-dependent epimerase/dehydratase family protein [Polyangiaceae bacterium]|nr:NAD-dependent epimerase/dehydratase family protein [Polyangiaceae bacterium]
MAHAEHEAPASDLAFAEIYARKREDLLPPELRERLETGAVVVTGICGRLGRRVARVLHRERSVVGLDRRPFPDRPKDIEHCQIDLRRKKAKDVFRHGNVAALVHLGVMHDPRDRPDDHHTWNVLGFQKLLEYVMHYDVPKVVLLSSANIYGPRPENPQFLSEDAPLLASSRFSEMRDLVELDMLAQSFFWKHPNTETVILRPAHILGTVRNAPSNYLRLPVVPTLMGFDPMMQAVHQDDVVSAIRLALRPGVRGIFNVAGPPPLPLSQAIQHLGRAHLPVPHSVAKMTLDRLFKVRLTSFPSPELDFIRYVCMVDDSRARQVLGYKHRYSIEETLRAVDEERWV